jgi:hypothetical protein
MNGFMDYWMTGGAPAFPNNPLIQQSNNPFYLRIKTKTRSRFQPRVLVKSQFNKRQRRR